MNLIYTGTGSVEQEGYIRDTIFHASTAESRDGDGGGDDPEELGAELGGVETSTRRRELSGNGNNNNNTIYPIRSKICWNFIVTAQLRDFDKDNISDRTLRAISKYTSNPEFEPEKVGVVSVAAKSLCMWVIAMEKYGKLYR